MRNLPLQTAATDALLLLPRLADILKGLIACLGIAKARLHGRPAGSEEPGRLEACGYSVTCCQMPCSRSGRGACRPLVPVLRGCTNFPL